MQVDDRPSENTMAVKIGVRTRIGQEIVAYKEVVSKLGIIIQQDDCERKRAHEYGTKRKRKRGTVAHVPFLMASPCRRLIFRATTTNALALFPTSLYS